MSRVKEPSTKAADKAKRNTQRRPGRAGPATRAHSEPSAHTPRQRTRRAPASARARAPRARPAPQTATYSRDERKSLLLLMAPAVVLTLAVGATQSLAPEDATRRQLALLPDPQTLSPIAIAPERLSASSGRAAPIAAAAPAEAADVSAPADVRPVLPQQTIATAPVRTAPLAMCVAPPHAARDTQSTPIAVAPSTFGRLLAAAARAQTADLVVYSDEYRQIGFPMGDVPAFYGVCTDVVVRAYRALGVDLQQLVHAARLGSGDPNIDHRRTKTLRRFFARYGAALPVTDFAEDYRAGDIVTYHRPDGRSSQSHIAIVADVIAPSGRPMIVHNRGWGPQLEDALFASAITGHYRFTSSDLQRQAALLKTAPSAHRLAHSHAAAPQRRVRVSAASAH